METLVTLCILALVLLLLYALTRSNLAGTRSDIGGARVWVNDVSGPHIGAAPTWSGFSGSYSGGDWGGGSCGGGDVGGGGDGGGGACGGGG
jgi:uncharacterized protein